MNNGKIWLVVKPTVGLPAFLGGVALIALAVHAAILTHSDWFPAYYNGNKKAKPTAMAPAAAPQAAATPQAQVPGTDTTVAVAQPAAAPPGRN